VLFGGGPIDGQRVYANFCIYPCKGMQDVAYWAGSCSLRSAPLRRKNTPATLGNLRNPELSFSASALLTGVSGRYRGTTRAAGSCKEGLGS
jgi:hypothetical protein